MCCPLVRSQSLSTTRELSLLVVSMGSLHSQENYLRYLINVFPTPRSPQQNRTLLSLSLSLPSPDHLLNSSVCMSHSPILLTRPSRISRCRKLGSRGDNQIRSWDQSFATVRWFHTLLGEFIVLEQLLLSGMTY